MSQFETEAEAIIENTGAKDFGTTLNGEFRVFAIPGNHTLETIQEYNNRIPKRDYDPSFVTVHSMVDFIERQGTEDSVIFADFENSRFVAIFDYHGKDGGADHCERKATCQLNWHDLITILSGGDFTHKELVRAIDEFEDYLSPKNEGVLESLRKMEIRSKDSLSSEVDPETGDIGVSWQTEKVSGDVKVPRSIRFEVPIFEHHEDVKLDKRYEIEVRIRVNHMDKGFRFETSIPKVDQTLRTEWKRLIECVSEIKEIPVFEACP